MKAEKVLKSVGITLKKRSSEIFTAIGIGGMITSVIFAVKATPKALELIEERKQETKSESLDVKEVVKTTWKCYIPTAAMCAASAACVIFAAHEGSKRSAALAAICSMSDAALREFQDKTEDIVGKEKVDEIKSAINKDKVESTPVVKNEVVVTGNGEQLCFDPLSGRYFKSSIEDIKKAVNTVNHQMLREMCVSLNDLYYELGLDSIKIGDILGWHVDGGCFEPSFDTQLSSDGVPCIVLGWDIPPKYNYDAPWD